MNVFDIVGPVMVGPSSSHTAGAARLGYMARTLLGAQPVAAEILLHGSFAKTYKGHGTDKALVAGVMGMKPDDIRLRFAPRLAAQQGLAVQIRCGEIEGAHPNTARIQLADQAGRSISLQGASVGGGNICITQVNGMEVEITGQQNTFIILHHDTPGTIAAVTQLLANQTLNISRFNLTRQQKGGTACMTVELDGSPALGLNQQIEQLPNILSSILLTAI